MVTRRTSQIGFLLGIVSFCCSAAMAETWYVDGAVFSSGEGTSWKTAFKTIQEGIDEARNGDTVMVAEGTYVENLQLRGKSLILRSRSPGNPTIVKTTIIDGDRAGSVVSYSGAEGGVLAGFTIQNGAAAEGGGIHGGAAPGCSARIGSNTIQDNSAKGAGGGVYRCNGVIVGNLIRRNEARWGAGISHCDGTIRHNTVTENSAEAVISGGEVHGFGGGLQLCHGLIEWNTITGNWAYFDGGGLRVCGGTIWNNVIIGNAAGSYGGGLHDCDGSVQNNTVTGNSASKEGGGLTLCHGFITNNVIWGNTAAEGSQFGLTSMPAHCCIQGWTGGGEGNTDRDPRFADRDGPDNDLETFEDNDYRLSPGSP